MANQNKKQSDGSIPDRVLNQLGEHTIGGFALFYFNSETGQPEQFVTFDTPAHCLALEKFIGDWSEAIHELNIETSKNSLIQNIEENEEISEEGEEE